MFDYSTQILPCDKCATPMIYVGGETDVHASGSATITRVAVSVNSTTSLDDGVLWHVYKCPKCGYTAYSYIKFGNPPIGGVGY